MDQVTVFHFRINVFFYLCYGIIIIVSNNSFLTCFLFYFFIFFVFLPKNSFQTITLTLYRPLPPHLIPHASAAVASFSSIMAENNHIKLLYHHFISNAIYIMLVPLLILSFNYLSSSTTDNLLHALWMTMRSNLPVVIICGCFLSFFTVFYIVSHPRQVYLVDFSCFKPGEDYKVTRETALKQFMINDQFTEESEAFQRKMLERCGIGQATYLPESLLGKELDICMTSGRKETTMVIFGAVDNLLKKTGVKPKDIGVLIVNCSLYNPTPSLSAMIVNHYKLRGNVISYSLGGMGCSAGLISVDLAKQLLQVYIHGLQRLWLNFSCS